MKKILVCLLAFCMLLSLFSCSAAKEPSEDVTAKETKSEEKKPEEPKEKENTETVYEDLTSDYKKLIEFRFVFHQRPVNAQQQRQIRIFVQKFYPARQFSGVPAVKEFSVEDISAFIGTE
jgi:hypothetical protein